VTGTSSNVTEFLLHGKDSGGIALQFLQGPVSYGELQRRTDQAAQWVLQRCGKKGDRVILISDNSLFWVVAYLGILRAGLVCVPLSTSISTEHLQHVIRTTEAAAVFAQSSFAKREKAILANVHVVTDADPLDTHTSQQLPLTGPDDLAALMFTSGSTGQPRGVMVSHRNIIANTESIILCLNLTESDRVMAVLPFYYCFGTSLLHTHLRVGASLVVDSRFMFPEIILRRMIETECTGFAGVPSHFQILLRSSSLPTKKFAKLRYVQQAGGHLAPAFVRELSQALPDTQIFIMYGQTEATARLSYLPPEFLETKMGSIGRGMPGVQLRVIGESGQNVLPGDVGEIVASGENVTRGYWCASEETDTLFNQGVLHTGDLATVDDDGFIFIVDRAKDFLKCRGERVGCRQLEEQLLDFDELLEAAVVGIPDDVLGESVKAFVVSRVADTGGLEERVIQFCKNRMPPQLVPRQVVVMASLPKNSAGKVLKSSLRILNAS